jgi:hypothetical protein
VFFVEVPNLKRLFFGNKQLAKIDFGLSNEATLVNSSNNNQVSDLNVSSGAYLDNNYLSNNLRTNVLTEMPGVSLTRNFSKSLSNRFNRGLYFNIFAKQKFTYQDNHSVKAFQNISRNYSNFVPGATISYRRSQFGEYQNNISLNLSSDIRIPTIDQLAPLIDSSNVYRVQRGNINLREAKTKDIRLYFNHIDQRGKNPLNYTINAFVNFTEDSFADSMFIDNQNRRTIFLANTDGYKSASMNAEVRKALKLKTNAIQINLAGSVSFSKNPGYLNNAFNFSNNLNTTGNFSATYTYKDKLSAEARETYNFYRSKQNSFNTNYSGENLSTSFSGIYNVNKKLSLSSNISINTSNPSIGKSINYNIWNASAVYRLLKGNNAEFKLTALDLLHQNNSILNSSNINSFTFATRNVLQQYFMTTFSYYPRKFGKTPAKK